jgi:group I intron endonuclease
VSYGVVYLITNLVNGKCYIGQTVDYAARMRQHRLAGSQCVISHAVKKYGWNNFSREILGEAEDKESLDNLEKLWIIIANSVESGYNREAGGANGKPCEATRLLQSAAKRGRTLTTEHRKNISKAQKGNRPPHAHLAMVRSLNGRIKTEDEKKKISNSLKGNIISPEQRERISNSLKGRIRSASHSRKLSESLQGHSVSQATRDKISATKRGVLNANSSS